MHTWLRSSALFALGVALHGWSVYAQDELPPPAPTATSGNADQQATPDGMEVLASGPLHEAFADTVRYKAEPGILVDREPPALIEEQPPESRPEGRDVVWIPGYWGWDDERSDYIWITGVYRNRPPGHRWVPGYWAPAEAQWQWVSGFWVEDDVQDVAYLPEPPDTLDQGPSSPAPGQDYFWNPGCWSWGSSNYFWRAGYWARCQQNWMWYPTYYNWTPRGYVCVNGRWDRPWNTRGLCFAPVYYRQPLYLNAGYYYRPWVAFNTGNFAWNLFVRPGYGHYYVGNYFGGNYNRYGYRPWYATQGRGGYDPFYNYYRWSNGRNNPRWENDIRDRYDHMARNDNRGPRDFREYQARRDQLDQRDRVAATLPELQRERGENNVRLVDNRNRGDDQFRANAQQFRELNNRRRDTELARGDGNVDERANGERNRDGDRNRDGQNAGSRGRLELPPTERTQVGQQGRERGPSNASRNGRVAEQGDRGDRNQRDLTNAPADRSQASPRNSRSYRAFRDEQGNVVVPDGRGGNETIQRERNENQDAQRQRTEAMQQELNAQRRNRDEAAARAQRELQQSRSRTRRGEGSTEQRNRTEATERAAREAQQRNRAEAAERAARDFQSRSRASRPEFNRAPGTQDGSQARQRSAPQQRAVEPRPAPRVESRSRGGGGGDASRSSRSSRMSSPQPAPSPQMAAPAPSPSRQGGAGGGGNPGGGGGGGGSGGGNRGGNRGGRGR